MRGISFITDAIVKHFSIQRACQLFNTIKYLAHLCSCAYKPNFNVLANFRFENRAAYLFSTDNVPSVPLSPLKLIEKGKFLFYRASSSKSHRTISEKIPTAQTRSAFHRILWRRLGYKVVSVTASITSTASVASIVRLY